MLTNESVDKLGLMRRYPLIFIIVLAMMISNCQVSPPTSAPATSPVSTLTEGAPATSSLTTPTPFESQPIADGPILLRSDITLRKVLEVGAGSIRLVRNPANDDVYLLKSEEGIFRLSNISASASREKVASIRDIKGAAPVWHLDQMEPCM